MKMNGKSQIARNETGNRLMSSLICPVCGAALKPMPVPQAVVWQCASCGGAMANLAVLRRYLRSDVVRSFWRRAIAASSRADKQCPSCRQSLRAFAVRQNEQTIILDMCPHCQLVWFDKGELDAFPKTEVQQLPPEVRQQLALMKVRSQDERVQFEQTAARIFVNLPLAELLLPWPLSYVSWLVYPYVRLIKFLVERKGWRWAIPVLVCGIGICLSLWFFLVPRAVAYPEHPLSADYQRNMSYLVNAHAQAPPDFSGASRGLLCCHIPIVSEEDFPLLTRKLRYELREAANYAFLFRVIVIGGMEVRDIDQPLLDASKRLSVSGRRNIQIVIVAPSTISDETQLVLEKRGLRIRKIQNPS